MELIIITGVLLALSIIMTFINVWCLAAMLVVTLDYTFLQKYEKKSLTNPKSRVILYIVKDKEDVL
jgi:hypothetical protein